MKSNALDEGPLTVISGPWNWIASRIVSSLPGEDGSLLMQCVSLDTLRKWSPKSNGRGHGSWHGEKSKSPSECTATQDEAKEKSTAEGSNQRGKTGGKAMAWTRDSPPIGANPKGDNPNYSREPIHSHLT